MRRAILSTQAFQRSAKRFLNKNPSLAPNLQQSLDRLSEDAFNPQLKTHKLKGELAGSWSCSAGYDLRIIFRFVHNESGEAILLQSVGTHDEVY